MLTYRYIHAYIKHPCIYNIHRTQSHTETCHFAMDDFGSKFKFELL